MKIAFAKVNRSPGDFRYEEGELSFSGELSRIEAHQVRLEGMIEGKMEWECDRCGASFEEAIRLPLNLRLSDRPLPVGDDLDTVEFLDGIIDIPALMESEIASNRSEYHYCPRCAGDGSEIDLEF